MQYTCPKCKTHLTGSPPVKGAVENKIFCPVCGGFFDSVKTISVAPRRPLQGRGVSLWRKLFGPTKGGNWYVAEDKSRCLTQVVLTSDPRRRVTSRFSSGTLPLIPRYMDLMRASPLATGLFRLVGDPGPYLLVRTDGTWVAGHETVDDMASDEFRVALTFARFPTSGLVAIFVSSSTLKLVSKNGFLEIVYGLDNLETRELLSDSISKDAMCAVLAGDSGCKYDIEIPLDRNCRLALTDAWSQVLAHHGNIRSPNYGAASDRLFRSIPAGTDPVMRV
jgi:hypothetical protein